MSGQGRGVQVETLVVPWEMAGGSRVTAPERDSKPPDAELRGVDVE